MPGAVVQRLAGRVFASGPFPHSACNFAMALSSEHIAEALAFVKEDRSRLLYTFTGGLDPVHDPQVRRVHRMSVMVDHAPAVAHHLPDLELGDGDRRVVSRFMAQQFFKNLSRETRDQIAAATEAAQALELLSFRSAGAHRIVGALMLSRTPSVLGLYNLCVDQGDRDRGVGRRMVRHVCHLAAAEDRLVTLQCDASLVPWYRDQGLRELTELHVWSASC